MNKILIILGLVIVVLALYFLFQNQFQQPENVNDQQELETKFERQGVQIEILKTGSGEEAKSKDILTMHYTGWLEDGTKFDSSVDRNIPFSFTLGIGQVIQGWDIGVSGMKIGEKRKLMIPSNLAYGETGVGQIPANATLIFEVELLGIQR